MTDAPRPPSILAHAATLIPRPDISHRDPPIADREWREPFLTFYRVLGNVALSARKAGVTSSTVHRYAKDSPVFKAEMQEAYEAFIGSMEEDLVMLPRRTGNVLGTIARLKAEWPEKYHERLQVEGRLLQLQIPVPEGEAQALLDRMRQHAIPASREILELPPPSDFPNTTSTRTSISEDPADSSSPQPTTSSSPP